MRNAIILLIFMSTALSACGQKNNQGDNGNEILAIDDYIKDKDYSRYEVATFAGGCFWCTEAAFERIEGVADVISGYSGGREKHPTYYEVSSGQTKHAESIQIYYDPEVINFERLLDVFFVAHDPTQLDRQGPDKGPQYRSAIFYHNDSQKSLAQAAVKKLDESGKFKDPVVTELNDYKEFWVAEAYHQDFYELNPNQPYVQSVSRPKVKKVEKEFASILKEKYRN